MDDLTFVLYNFYLFYHICIDGPTYMEVRIYVTYVRMYTHAHNIMYILLLCIKSKTHTTAYI